MTKDVLIEKGSLGTRLGTYALDLLTWVCSTIILYFVILYSVFATGFNFVTNSNTINRFKEENNLNLKYGEDYKSYKEVIDDFFFVKYKEEIISDFIEDGRNWSIEYIYNVIVLGLPQNPTSSNYKSLGDIYQYVQNEDGSYDVNTIGIINPAGNGEYFERNVMDLFYETYKELDGYLLLYEPEYLKAYDSVDLAKRLSRTLSAIISSLIIYMILPLINKNGSTLFERYKKIGYVNSRNLLRVSTIRVCFRPLVVFLIPIVGIFFFTKYTVVLLTVLPLFVNFMMMILSRNNKDIYEVLCGVRECSLEESKIFDTDDEFKEFSEREEFEDKKYVDGLNKIDSVNIERK